MRENDCFWLNVRINVTENGEQSTSYLDPSRSRRDAAAEGKVLGNKRGLEDINGWGIVGLRFPLTWLE